MINVPNTELTGQIAHDSFIYDHVNDPIEFLSDFFGRHDLQTHLKKMKRWKMVVTSNAYFEINTLFNPLHDHKMMCNLINVAWTMLITAPVKGELENLDKRAQELFLNKECLGVPFYPSHLSTAELIDPYLGIHDFFESFTLPDAHQQLYKWLNIGMSPNVCIENEDCAQTFYKKIRKLISSCWLILHRTIPTFSTLMQDGEPLFNEQPETEISEQVLDHFKQFLTVVPPKRLNRNLRKMLIDYLFYNINGLPTDFEEALNDFYWLTALLDEIEGKDVDLKYK